jgi:DNA helicase II / ATP-dependent DNA helicase PcrA
MLERVFDVRWDAGLNDAQLSAVTHDSAPLVVVAGAGTGKTRTLTSRVASLVDRGVPSERILLLTFTRRAADDMLARAAMLCGDRDVPRRLWGGTFHAVAHRLIAEHGQSLGLDDISVLDAGDAADMIDLLRDDHGLTCTRTRMPRPATLLAIYTRSVNTDRPAREVITADFPWCEPHADAVMALLRDYVARKRAQGSMDFDDLLLAWRALLAQPVIKARLVQRWDHVLVDEYQDVNQIQVDIVRELRPGGRGLTVVGDDAQAVYGFRGASSAHLLDLAAALPGARVVRLERNFRSRQPLLDLANVVRPGAGEHRLVLQADRAGGGAVRPRLRRCHDASDEARAVLDDILTGVDDGQRLRDHAVLMRSAHHSDLLEIELTARRVPFVKYGGLRYLEAAHVKDFLAVLRLTHNRRDEMAWFRLLRMHDGIGPARSRALLPLLTGAATDADNAAVAAAPAQARVGLDATLARLGDARGLSNVADRVTGCLTLLRPLVQARYRDSGPRLENLERLASAAARSADLAAFVADVTLDPPVSTSDYAKPPHLDDDYVTLSTVHSAKGLEWPAVHVIHCIDGAFPSDMALSTPTGLEEEQRLFYVAVTRARDQLTMYAPLRLPHHRHARDDRHSYAPASRFLTADAMATLDVREAERAPAAAPKAADLPAVAMPSLDTLFG